jgi:hypothetical protein
MVKNREIMAKKIAEEMARRRQPPDKDADKDHVTKLRVEILYGDSDKPRDFSAPCAVCERRFHPRNLVGMVPFMAVVKWRDAHKAPFDPRDRRLWTNHVYEDVRTCIFCTQFFDVDFPDYLNYHRGMTERRDSILLLEGNREGSNLDPGVTYRLQEFVKGRPAKELTRPLSRLNLQLTLMALRQRKEQPLLMADLGCEVSAPTMSCANLPVCERQIILWGRQSPACEDLRVISCQSRRRGDHTSDPLALGPRPTAAGAVREPAVLEARQQLPAGTAGRERARDGQGGEAGGAPAVQAGRGGHAGPQEGRV